MKKITLLLFVLIGGIIEEGKAQQVPKSLVVEYFTNTYCSVCALRNPGFYANLENFPQVLHVAYHPSLPYPSCPLSQHNKPENDARTVFYGLLNGTPKMVIQGEVIAVNEDYGNPELFSTRLGQTSSFAMQTTLEAVGSDSARAVITIRKMDTSYLDSFNLYSVVVEDTLNFAASNGEMLHHDVFRKSLFGSLPIAVPAPLLIGDSVQYSQVFWVNTVWNRPQSYCLGMISTPDKKIIQAAASGRLPQAILGINNTGRQALHYSIFPIPAGRTLQVTGDFSTAIEARVINAFGQIVLRTRLSSHRSVIGLEDIPQGTYLLQLQSATGRQVLKFDHVK